MESSNLPKELLIEILARLPVKSLMRFKSVCKFFYSLIKSDHHFMHKHYKVSGLKRNHILREFGYPFKTFNMLSLESESNEIDCIYLEVKIHEETRSVKCCCGMLCMILSESRPSTNYNVKDLPVYDVLIWNPYSREIKSLPSIRMPYKPSNRFGAIRIMEEHFGFGFSNNMTWKVVMIFYIIDKYVKMGDMPPFEIGDSHEMVMVCSQVGDSWSWRQIDGFPHFRLDNSEDFYLKGKYYWRIRKFSITIQDKHELLWFDMGDEVFGTLELPSNIETGTVSVTTMNETIALLSFPNQDNGYCIEIWLMNENNNNINWYKQTSINCGASIDTPKGTWNELWGPIAISNSDSHLLVFPYAIGGWHYDDEDTYVPYLISIDLVTQRSRMIYITIENKSIYFVRNPVGYVQVYNKRDINEKWMTGDKMFGKRGICGMYARVYHESIYSI